VRYFSEDDVRLAAAGAQFRLADFTLGHDWVQLTDSGIDYLVRAICNVADEVAVTEAAEAEAPVEMFC